MEKVFVKAYLNDNLGDDLFIHILSNRYKNCKFYLVSYKKINVNFSQNVVLCSGKKNVFLNRFLKVISFCKYGLEDYISKSCKKTILIGGSMFIEKCNKLLKLPKNKKYYIIGTNFGPYNNDSFKNYYYHLFENAEDVCFREKYSYDLFKKLNNVRVAPDIVFSFDTNYITAKEDNSVIISVIDCEKKQCGKYRDEYEKLIVNLIKQFYDLNYKIVLMSFCKNEGDEKAIFKIMNRIDNTAILKNISTYFYSGNINEALTVLKKSSIIVGSRFHANVLGLVMGKTIVPIAYSDKTINTLNDIGFNGKIIDIRKLDYINIDELSDEDLSYKINIDKYAEEATKHFKKIDELFRIEGI